MEFPLRDYVNLNIIASISRNGINNLIYNRRTSANINPGPRSLCLHNLFLFLMARHFESQSRETNHISDVIIVMFNNHISLDTLHVDKRGIIYKTRNYLLAERRLDVLMPVSISQ